MTSGGPSYVQNTRERILSSSFNDPQTIAAYWLMEAMRYAQSLRVLGNPSDSVRNVVLGGLTVSPSGDDVSVAPGAMMQNSATIVPVPVAPGGTTAPISPYRLAENAVSAVVVMPAPGAETFYLIEARTVQVTVLTQTVDIWDEALQVFVPTAAQVKRKDNQIEFQLLTGGANAPAPTGGDWVPIAIVRKGAGGGATVASDIIDVRPLAEFGRERPAKPTVMVDRAACLLGAGAATNRVQVFSQIDGPGGLRTFELLSSSSGSEDMTAARFISPSVVLAANTRYYLYLASWSALALNPRYTDGLTDQYEGVLVLSEQVPTSSGRNPAGMTLPAPYGVSLCPAQTAYYVCTLMRNNANTGWVGFQRSNGRVLFPVALTTSWDETASPPSIAFTPANHGISPRARHLMLHYVNNGAGAAAWKLLSVLDTTAGVSLASTYIIDDSLQAGELEFPYDGQATLTASVGGGNAGDSLTVAVRGYVE